MDKKNLLLFAAIGIALFFIIKAIKKSMSDLKNNANDVAANLLPWVRSTAAKEAIAGLKKLKFLDIGAYNKLEPKYNNVNYILIPFADYNEADDIAEAIEKSNSLLPLGIDDDSAKALANIYKIKNQVQAAQVTARFFDRTGKSLGARLGEWIADGAAIDTYTYLSTLPTGVINKATNEPLKTL